MTLTPRPPGANDFCAAKCSTHLPRPTGEATDEPGTAAHNITPSLRPRSASAWPALRGDYYTSEDLVICKPDGRPYRPDSTSTQFRTFVDRHGLPKSVHVHTLRHSAASFLAAAGVPASDIAAQLGHADGGALALKVYVHPMAEGLAPRRRHLDHLIGGGQA